MKLTEEVKDMAGAVTCRVFVSDKGQAVLTKNMGCRDYGDRWMVSVMVDGKYTRLATRANYSKAVAMAEDAIG